MKKAVYKISLDIYEHGSQAVLKAKKTDTGRKLHITLRTGGAQYIIEDDCYAVFKATKPDGSILYNACTIENNEIIYEFTEQTCTAVGRCRCEIALYGLGGNLITSPKFALLVDGTIYPDETVESTDEFSALTTLVTESMGAISGANQAAGDATKASQDAESAADNASKAAVAANNATNNASEAAVLANTSKDDANKAAKTANDAAVYATGAATAANNAANSANTAADGANEAKDNANLAAESAHKTATKVANTVKNFMVIGKAEGTNIALTDAIEQFFVGCRIFGKTTQDGTPTPDAPVDLLSAGDIGSIGVAVATGKNLLAKPFLLGVHSTSGYSNINDKVISTDGFYLKAGTYVISGTISDAWSLYINGMTNIKTTSGYQRNIPGRAFDIPEDGLYNVQFNRSDGKAFTDAEIRALNSSAQVEFGSTPTYYEPYNGQILTISTSSGLPGIPVTSGGNYIDATGQQWICDEIDFARGVYVQRVEQYSLAVADMNNSESYPGWKNAGIAKYYPNANSYLAMYGATSMCNIASNSRGSTHINTVSGSDTLMIPNPSGMTQSGWKAQYPNLVFELIVSIPTTIETPLSEEEIAAYAALHTYRDNTTIFNDASAHMDIEYVMDAKKYIDSLVSGSILSATVE